MGEQTQSLPVLPTRVHRGVRTCDSQLRKPTRNGAFPGAIRLRSVRRSPWGTSLLSSPHVYPVTWVVWVLSRNQLSADSRPQHSFRQDAMLFPLRRLDSGQRLETAKSLYYICPEYRWDLAMALMGYSLIAKKNGQPQVRSVPAVASVLGPARPIPARHRSRIFQRYCREEPTSACPITSAVGQFGG